MKYQIGDAVCLTEKYLKTMDKEERKTVKDVVFYIHAYKPDLAKGLVGPYRISDSKTDSTKRGEWFFGAWVDEKDIEYADRTKNVLVENAKQERLFN